MKTPFFILGFGRSGTTLLASMLSTSPDIYIPPELRGLYSYYRRYKYFGDLSKPFNLKLLANELCYLHELKTLDMKLNDELFIDKLTSRSINGEAVIVSFYETLLESSGKTRIGDKTIRHTLSLDTINMIFPDAKIVHMMRDGRDCALSHRKISSDYNVYLSAIRWKKFNQILLDFGKKHKERYLCIKYEDLVTRPEEILREVCFFLDEPFSEELLNFSTNDYASRKAKLMSKHHSNLGSRIIKDNFNKWEKGLTADEIKLFESVAGKMLTGFGYKLRNDFSGLHWRLLKIYYFISNYWDEAKFRLGSFRFIGIILLKRFLKVHRLRDLHIES